EFLHSPLLPHHSAVPVLSGNPGDRRRGGIRHRLRQRMAGVFALLSKLHGRPGAATTWVVHGPFLEPCRRGAFLPRLAVAAGYLWIEAGAAGCRRTCDWYRGVAILRRDSSHNPGTRHAKDRHSARRFALGLLGRVSGRYSRGSRTHSEGTNINGLAC